MTTTSPLPVRGRAGISLLEVLISMFILAVGIISVLSLFTAGREIQARTATISRAVSFADQMAAMVQDWRQLSEWQARQPDGTFAWVNLMGPVVQLPVVIDPYGLNANTVNENPNGWDWANFANIRYQLAEPVTSPPAVNNDWLQYFRRIALPSVPRQDNPNPITNRLRFEEAISLFADADAVEYVLPTDPRRPPENQFEFGRRKRGGDLSPALMVARQDWQSTAPSTGVPMRYWLLVAHKQPRGYDSNEAGSQSWPQGSLRFDVTSLEHGLLAISLPTKPTDRKPKDTAALRRGLQPGRWLLLTRWNGSGWMIHWTKMTSVTGKGDDRWLVVPAQAPEPEAVWQYESTPPPPPGSFPPVAFSFDSIVDVRVLTELNGQPLF